MDIFDIIDERIDQLSNKSRHYVVDIGTLTEHKEEKVFHKPLSPHTRWCSTCERIRELKRLKNILKEQKED